MKHFTRKNFALARAGRLLGAALGISLALLAAPASAGKLGFGFQLGPGGGIELRLDERDHHYRPHRHRGFRGHRHRFGHHEHRRRHHHLAPRARGRSHRHHRRHRRHHRRHRLFPFSLGHYG